MARDKNAERTSALAGLTEPDLELGPFVKRAKPKDAIIQAHWRTARDEDDIAWAILDKQGSSTNTLAQPVLAELDSLLDTLEKNPPKALVIRSAKKNGFIAGAEISEFKEMKDPAEAEKRLGQGLDILARLEKFPAPTIALIHGFCLGGGLEVALACRYRIARDDVKLGFPEVMLGLHPGLAGTWRSLKLLDPITAMRLMLTGRSLDGRRAKRAGLVDSVTQERHFAEAVKFAANGKLRLNRVPAWRRGLMNLMPVRAIAAKKMIKQTRAKARPEHYPAPYAMIEMWRTHGTNSRAMARAETKSFVELMSQDTAQNLVRVFFLQERLKALGKTGGEKPDHVHVIGAGTMGGDIAAWCALKGMRVTLQDREAKYIAPAMERASKLFKRRYLSPGETKAAFDLLIPDAAAYGLEQADIVIEAVPENLEIKKTVFAAAEAVMRPDAILATNTSTILLEQMTPLLKHPERLVGVHFFNPVAKMPLVEIITHAKLDPKITQRALAFTGAISKFPLPVKSAPGFLVNRALTPYLLEALACLDEGLKPEMIDEAAEKFGMPMGPVALADQVGLDICLHASNEMRAQLEIELPELPGWFEEKIKRGDLGRKTGRGLYEYAKGKPKKKKLESAPDPALADRLILPMINAVVACLRDGLIEDADIADAGMIFGAGFAPFTGGPINYVRNRGIKDVVETLKGLERTHGKRFTPDAGWENLT